MDPGDRFETEYEDSSMGYPYLTSFLWCMNLKVGSRLISIVHCVFSTVVVMVGALMAHDASQYLGSDEDSDRVYTHSFRATLAIACGSVVHMLLSFMLCYGVFWRKPALLRVWVVVMSVLYVAGILFMVVTTIVYGFSATGSDIFLNFLLALMLFVFIGYCILCVHSYHLMLKSAEDMDRPNKTDY